MAMKSFRETYQPQITFQINQTAAWLNKFDREAISPITEPYLEKAGNANIPLVEVKEVLNRAVVLSRRFESSLETPEVQVRGALILFSRGDLAGAMLYLEDAITFYQEYGHDHRHAVGCLMMGFFELSAGNRSSTLFHWGAARKSFETCLRKAERDPMRSYRDPFDEKVKWYAERLGELNVDEVLIPEQVVGWLNRYDPVSLNMSMGALRDKLYEEAAEGNVESVKKAAELVSVLAPREDQPHTTALMFTHAGAALLLVGETPDAVNYLKHGLALSNRRSHQGAMTAWLKALAEWQIPEKRKEAVISSRRTSDIFQELALISDHQDRQGHKTWYLSTRVALMEAAERLFKLFLPDLLL